MRITIVLSAVLLFLTACQNDPDSTVVGVLPEGDLVGALRFDSQADSSDIRNSTYLFRSNHQATTALSVGEADGDQSKTLLRWLYFGVTTDQAYGGRIVSATLRLHSLPYHVGDVNAPFSMEARALVIPDDQPVWNVYTATADSLEGNRPGIGEVVGSYQGSFGESDSIDVAIDTTLIRRWMQLNVDKDEKGNSLFYRIHGLALQAPAGGSGSIRSFQSRDNNSPRQPSLTVVMENAGVLDTIEVGNMENTSLAFGPDRNEAGRIVLQSGVSYRGKLFFDMSAIPAASVINHAVLYLTRDAALSTRYYHGADTVLVYESVDSTDNVLSSTGIITRVESEQPDVLIAEGSPLTRAVQNWVNRKGNYGLILVPMYELSDLDRMALYGAGADADKRPRLVVTYTTKPDLP